MVITEILVVETFKSESNSWVSKFIDKEFVKKVFHFVKNRTPERLCKCHFFIEQASFSPLGNENSPVISSHKYLLVQLEIIFVVFV